MCFCKHIYICFYWGTQIVSSFISDKCNKEIAISMTRTSFKPCHCNLFVETEFRGNTICLKLNGSLYLGKGWRQYTYQMLKDLLDYWVSIMGLKAKVNKIFHSNSTIVLTRKWLYKAAFLRTKIPALSCTIQNISF